MSSQLTKDYIKASVVLILAALTVLLIAGLYTLSNPTENDPKEVTKDAK